MSMARRRRIFSSFAEGGAEGTTGAGACTGRHWNLLPPPLHRCCCWAIDAGRSCCCVATHSLSTGNRDSQTGVATAAAATGAFGSGVATATAAGGLDWSFWTDSFTISNACSCCLLALSSGDDNTFSCSVFCDAAVAACLLLL